MKLSHTILVSTIPMLLLVARGSGSGSGEGTPGAGASQPPQTTLPPQTVFQERTDRILARNPAVLASDTLERTVLDGSRPSQRSAPFACNAGRCIHPFFEGEYSISDTFDTEYVEGCA